MRVIALQLPSWELPRLLQQLDHAAFGVPKQQVLAFSSIHKCQTQRDPHVGRGEQPTHQLVGATHDVIEGYLNGGNAHVVFVSWWVDR